MGGPLVTRSGTDTRLTPLGQRYLAWGSDAQRKFDSIATADDDDDVTPIYVAVLGAALGTTGPAILAEWRARFPGRRLVPMPVTAQSIADPLAQGADVVFGQLLGDEPAALGWQTHVTTSAPRALVMPREWDQADADMLTPPEVADLPLIYATAGDARHAQWMNDLPVHEGPRDTAVTTPDAVARAVEITGRASLHTMAAAPTMATPDTAWVPLAGRPLDIGVAIHPDAPPAVRALFDLARLCHTLDDLDSLDL
nr:LysR substrate-binding domain-containing protein [Nocardiopsis flavescens]